MAESIALNRPFSGFTGVSPLPGWRPPARLLAGVVTTMMFAANCVAIEPYTIFDPYTAITTAQDDEESELDLDPDLGDLDLDKDIGEDDDSMSRLNRSIFGDVSQRVPQFDGNRFVLPALMAATTDTAEIGNGRMPDGFRDGESTPVIGLPESLFDRGLPASWTIRQWAAPNTFSLPRYFEDRMLERHGHEPFGCLQPVLSGTHFFATIPMLPYLMTVDHPCQCEYQLGYYRPGSCAPMLKQRPPYERRAMLTEAAAISGGILLLP